MTKRISIVLIFIFISLFINYAEEIDISKVEFDGMNLLSSDYKDNVGEVDQKFNIAYSPFLPAGGVYLITDIITGKEAVIQVGFAKVDKSPYVIYLPELIYNFFIKAYDKPVDKIKLKIKFLAWNKEGEEASNLDIFNLIVKPEDSYGEINKNGVDNYYIQLGAFNYYQNSYPIIVSLLPLLNVMPKFYMIKSGGDDPDMFRVLAGPYTLDKARDIAKSINMSKKATVFIHYGKNIINTKDKK